jgi:hypothetical protein
MIGSVLVKRLMEMQAPKDKGTVLAHIQQG